MMSSLNPAIYVQIKNLIQGLVNKKSMRNNKNELLSVLYLNFPFLFSFKLVEIAGPDAAKYLFICLFESIDFKDPKIQNGSKDSAKTQFLIQHLTSSSSESSFLDYFAQVLFIHSFPIESAKVIEKTCPKPSCLEYIYDINRCLKLALSIQIIIATSLYLSPNKQISKDGIALQ